MATDPDEMLRGDRTLDVASGGRIRRIREVGPFAREMTVLPLVGSFCPGTCPLARTDLRGAASEWPDGNTGTTDGGVRYENGGQNDCYRSDVRRVEHDVRG